MPMSLFTRIVNVGKSTVMLHNEAILLQTMVFDSLLGDGINVFLFEIWSLGRFLYNQIPNCGKTLCYCVVIILFRGLG